MEKNEKRTIGKRESIAESLQLLFCYVLDLILCVYMLLILLVLPLYLQEGYAHIGTDKAMFLQEASLKTGKILLPVLAIVWLLGFCIWSQKVLKESRDRKFWGNKLWVTVKEYCQNELSITDYFALFYGAAVLLSYFCSNYKKDALWGVAGWYMGTQTQLFLLFFYFVISRQWKRRKWLLVSVLPVSMVVLALGYLNRFGLCPVDKNVVNVSFISTIGNINWFCGYLVSIFFGGFCLLWGKRDIKFWQKFLLMGYVCVGFGALVMQGSASGMVAFGGILLVTFWLSASDGQRMQNFWLEMVLFSVVCALTYWLRLKEKLVVFGGVYVEVIDFLTNSKVPLLMTVMSLFGYMVVAICNWRKCYPKKLFLGMARVLCGVVALIGVVYLIIAGVNTMQEGALLTSTPLAENKWFLFSRTWGSTRGATWLAACMCFKEQNFLHKLVGVGPNSMAIFLYEDGSAALHALVEECFGAARLTNAHNEWLTILVDTGVLGFIGFVGMMVTAIWRYIGYHKQNIVVTLCGFCLLAYTINNMFSFQQSVSVSTMGIVLAVGENFLRAESLKKGEM